MAGRRGRVAAVPKALLKGLNAQSQASLTAALQAPGAPSKDDPRYNSFVESLRGSLLTKQGLRRRGSSAGTGERDDASESEDEEEENGSEDDAKAKDEEDEPQGQRGKRLSRSSSAAVLVEPVAIPLSEQPLLSKETLRQSLANTSAKGKEKLDVDVEDLFQDIVSAFVRESLVGACRLSRHRRSTMLEMRDLQLHLDKKYNISLPGFGGPLKDGPIARKRATAKSGGTQAHNTRLAQVREAKAKTGGLGRGRKGGK